MFRCDQRRHWVVVSFPAGDAQIGPRAEPEPCAHAQRERRQLRARLFEQRIRIRFLYPRPIGRLPCVA